MSDERAFDLEMVERTIGALSDPSLDETRPEVMAALLREYVRFEAVMERGLVTPEAAELAAEFLAFAREWIHQQGQTASYEALKRG